jgi:hypothetical protein
MSDQIAMTDASRFLQRLARTAVTPAEKSFVTSPGDRTVTTAVKVISNNSYNLYNVRMVELKDPPTPPILVGDQFKALNIAEPSNSQGSLPADTYVLISKVGEKYAFYAPV